MTNWAIQLQMHFPVPGCRDFGSFDCMVLLIIYNRSIFLFAYRFLKVRHSPLFSRDIRDYEDKFWKDVTVGDIIRLSCNDEIPADMVLIYSTDADGICHIETSSLDGETNLKQRLVVKGYEDQVYPPVLVLFCLTTWGCPFTVRWMCSGPQFCRQYFL